MTQFSASGGQSSGVSASVSVLTLNIQADFIYDGLVGSPCSPRDSQESSPAVQFKSINSSVLSLLYDTTHTSLHDYWKNRNFHYRDLCLQSDVSAFLIRCLGLSQLSFLGASIFEFHGCSLGMT